MLTDKNSKMQIGALGLDTMKRAESRVNRTAVDLSRAGDLNSGGDQVDLSADMVALLAARESFSTGAKLVATEEQMSRALIDLLA